MARPQQRLIVATLALAASAAGCFGEDGAGAGGATGLPDDLFLRRGLPPEASVGAVAGVAPGEPQVEMTRLDETPPVLRVRVTDVGDGGLAWAGAASCQVVLRLYATADREGEPAWRSDATPGVGCTAGRPDPDRADARRFAAAEILGDSLPGGRYFGTATVRAGDVARTVSAGDVYLWADSLPPEDDRERLRWTVETAVVGTAPAELVAAVTVTNAGSRRVRLPYDACALRLRLHRTPLRLLPVWRAESRPGGTATCEGEPQEVVLAPRESYSPDELRITAPVPEILGDSLREGHYYVGAELALPAPEPEPARLPGWARLIGGRGGAEARERVPLEAGVVELRGRTGQLTEERTAGGLTYRAASQVMRGAEGADTVRVAVVVTNTGGRRVETAVLRECPVLVYAYRDADERDALPLRRADWEPPTEQCAGAGHRYALEPGASWIFHADVPAAPLRALGEGPAYLTAVLRTPERLVALRAGEVR